MPGMDRLGEEHTPPVRRSPPTEPAGCGQARQRVGHQSGLATLRAQQLHQLTATEMVIVNHCIAMLNQIGLSGAEADKLVYGDKNGR